MKKKEPAPQRRRSRGAAWYWQQTDTWYYTPRGTKKRETLRDEKGRPIRGLQSKHAAQLALARIRITQGMVPAEGAEESMPAKHEPLVAEVCADYIRHCERALTAGRMHPEFAQGVRRTLNQFCRYCGALPVAELKRAYVSEWVSSVPTWRSPVTRRNVLTTIISAFRHAETERDIRSPLKGLKKPPHRPRLHSISPDDEKVIYRAAEPAFRDFVFALIHTGLRPFCELAKLTAANVEETPRGMMWRLRSSKTKKLRKIPVRPEVAKLVRRLLKTAGSDEPIFRNCQGNPWKKPTGVDHFVRLKRHLGWTDDDPRAKYSCYSCRHTFAHRMLSGYWNEGVGCSIEVLAELMGDTPKTAYDHYGREWGQHYQEPLWAAIGEAGNRSRRRE
ncbi:MAG: tyrosine-type recombinase/integrase [Planctomycetales bacterium]|nr:tyrosine-type recombinase/integrase [Planctomycetales bacterium]